MIRKCFLSLLIFVISYLFFLFLWLQVKDAYGNALTVMASNIISLVNNVEFKEVKEEKEKRNLFFTYKEDKEWLIGIELMDPNKYTFQTPLTLAIMGGLFLFLTRKSRAYVETLLILFFIHLLHVFAMEIADLSAILTKMGFNNAGVLGYHKIWLSLWRFMDIMVIRFYPFLIGAYLYLRFVTVHGCQGSGIRKS